MGLFDFLRRKKQLPVQPRAPADIAAEEKRLNKAINDPRHPVVRISPELNKKIQAQIKAKEVQMAAARARRIANYNVRR